MERSRRRDFSTIDRDRDRDVAAIVRFVPRAR